MKRIDQLPVLAAIEKSNEDFLPIVDASTGVTKRISVGALLDNVVSVFGLNVQVGVVLANSTGTPISFNEAFTDTDYAFIPFGVKDGGNVQVSLGVVQAGTRTVSSITVYPALDATYVYYIAIGA